MKKAPLFRAVSQLTGASLFSVLCACSGGGTGSNIAPIIQTQSSGIEKPSAIQKLSITSAPVAKIPLTAIITAQSPGVQINLANRRTPGSALRDATALRRVQPNYSGSSPSTGALLVELAHTGSLSDPESIVSSGANLWVGEFASSNVVKIATPGDVSTTYALGSGHNVSGIALDSSSTPWFSDPTAYSYGYISSGVAHEKAVGSTYGQGMSSATFGPNSHMYFTAPTSKTIIDVTPSTPTSYGVLSLSPYAANHATSAAGALWLAANGYLIKCTVGSGGITALAVTGIGTAGDTWSAIATGADGNLYISDQTTKYLTKVTLSGGVPVSYAQYNLGAAPAGISPGKNGDTDLWVALPSINEVVAFNYTAISIDATVTPPSASSLPESITNTSDDSVWWGEKATGLLGTYGDLQTFAAMYGYLTMNGNDKWGGYYAGYSTETPYGGSLTGASGCLGDFSFVYPTFPDGSTAQSQGTTAVNPNGSGTCFQEWSSTHGEQGLNWPLP